MLGCEMFPYAEACPQETHTNKLHRPVSGLLGALCQWQGCHSPSYSVAKAQSRFSQLNFEFNKKSQA